MNDVPVSDSTVPDRDTECTGVAADWCPNHGTCTCTRGPNPGAQGDDPYCPIHGAYTSHPIVTVDP